MSLKTFYIFLTWNRVTNSQIPEIKIKKKKNIETKKITHWNTICSTPFKNQITQTLSIQIDKAPKTYISVNPIFPTFNDSSSAKFKKKRISLESMGNQVTHWRRRRSKNRSWNFVELVFAQSRPGLRLLCVQRIVSKKMRQSARKAVWLCNKDMRRVRKNVHT